MMTSRRQQLLFCIIIIIWLVKIRLRQVVLRFASWSQSLLRARKPASTNVSTVLWIFASTVRKASLFRIMGATERLPWCRKAKLLGHLEQKLRIVAWATMALPNYHSGICRKKLGTDFEWLGRSVSWKPLGGSPELHQLQNQKIWVRGSHRMAPMMTKFKAIRAQ